ncbi:multicopper oxidase domain-containing protein [Nonomuraea polychroma]
MHSAGRPYEVVDVLARFHGYRGRYMLHCHNLEHETWR